MNDDKKPLVSPLLIQEAIEVGWTKERIEEVFEIPDPPDEETVNQARSQFRQCGDEYIDLAIKTIALTFGCDPCPRA